jgi:WS/DGAT/MGAT family acyltransferase
MKQLGILDAAFINLEHGNNPQHVGGLGIYDPSTAPGGFVRFKQVIANFERRLQAMPLFRTRLVQVPGGLDRPYWVKDANFDVEFHLRHIALPEPGDWRQLCIQAARLHARPIDMSRPLWEAYIIEGLDNIPNLPKGSFAVYTKMHHSLVDGAGGASFMSALHDLVANPTESPTDANEPLLVDREPSVAELLGKASINRVRNTLSMTRGTIGLARELGEFAYRVARKEVPMPDVQSPKTRFNDPVGPHRVFDALDFSLEDFKRAKDASGTKVNDVALAIIGGALRRYLDAKGETPEGPLAASMPVNMRTRRGVNDDNNQVGSIFASLHSDITDPLERLKAIHSSTAEAKQFGEASPMVDTLKLAGVFSPAVTKFAAGVWADNHLGARLPINISTVISNVAGPDFPLYCAGARLVRYHGLGLLTPNMGLFHLVFSYCGGVTMSVLGDRDTMPDPEFYKQCLQDSFDELMKALPAPAKPAARKKAASGSAKAGKRKPATGKAARSSGGKKSKAATKATTRKQPARKKAAKKAPAKAAKPRAVSGNAKARPKAKRKAGTVAPKLRVVNN